MFDIDPPSPVLRLSDYRKPNKFGGDPNSFAAQLDRYMAAKADRWARLHEPGGGTGGCLATDRIRTLAVADGDLAYALDSAL